MINYGTQIVAGGVNMSIGQNIKKYRKEKGYTQEDIAKATKIARPNVARIESGKNSPTIEVLTKLAHALDMQLELRFVEKV